MSSVRLAVSHPRVMSSVRLAARLRAERRPRVMMRVSGCSFAPSVGLGTEGRVRTGRGVDKGRADTERERESKRERVRESEINEGAVRERERNGEREGEKRREGRDGDGRRREMERK